MVGRVRLHSHLSAFRRRTYVRLHILTYVRNLRSNPPAPDLRQKNPFFCVAAAQFSRYLGRAAGGAGGEKTLFCFALPRAARREGTWSEHPCGNAAKKPNLFKNVRTYVFETPTGVNAA